MITVIASLYLTEKYVDYIIPVFEETDKVDFETQQDFKDSNMFKVVKRVFEGEEPRKVFNDEY